MLTNQNQYITGIIACARPLQPLLAANAPFSTRSLSFIYLALLPPLSNTTKPTTSKDTRKFGNTWPAAAKHGKYQCSSTASFFYPLSSSLVLQYGILYYGGIIWCEERKKLGVPADVDGNTGKHVKKIIDEKLPPWLPHPSALLRDDGTWCCCCCSHHSRSSVSLSFYNFFSDISLCAFFSVFPASWHLDNAEDATFFLACLKVFLSNSMHLYSSHFDPLDSSSVDWFHLQKLIPSGPLYHDCISPKLCFLQIPCRIVGQ